MNLYKAHGKQRKRKMKLKEIKVAPKERSMYKRAHVKEL